MMALPPKKPVIARLTPAGVALFYAVFAALWIIVSGYLLAVAVSDPLLQGRIELVKGLLFVAVTGMLLYLLLKGWHGSPTGATTLQAGDIAPPRNIRLALAFAALMLVVPLVGLSIVRIYIPQEERDAYRNLEAVVRLKAGQIENWLGERRGDSEGLAASAGFAQQVEQYIRHGKRDGRLLGQIMDRLASLRTDYAYDSILLFDTSGQLLASLGEDVDIPSALRDLLHQSLASKQVQRSSPYRDESGNINLDWVVPIAAPDRQGKHAVAAVVLRVVPDHFLYPLVRAWPSASASAETLLVRRDGESIVFLNELRHRKDKALTLRLPLSEPELPEAAAIRANRPGTVRGRNYRGKDVLAAYRPVAGTRWHIVAEIDRGEVLHPMWELVHWITLIAFVTISSIMAALLLLWRQQQRTQRLASRMQSVAATEENEQRFYAITQSANDAIITADSGGNVANWNPSAERLFGYTETEMRGQSLMLLAPERFRNSYSQGFMRVAAGGKPYVIGKTVELVGLRKGGSEFPLELSLAQWETAAGKFFTAIIRDISERKAAESLLVEHELQYRTLADSGQALIWMAGTDKLCNYFNKVWLEFTGRSMEQEWGNGWAEGVHPDDFQRCLDAYVAAFDRREKFSITYRLRRHDGEYRWLQDDGCPRYDSKGGFIGYIGYCLDVTERMQAEEELQRFFNLIPDLACVASADGYFLKINPMWQETLGYTEQEILSRPFLDFVHPDDKAATIKEVNRQLAGEATMQFSNRYRCKDGSYRWMEWKSTPAVDGKLLFASARDITERKKADD